MRSSLNQLENFVLWGLFFATTVYGHIALKVAATQTAGSELKRIMLTLQNVWGWTAMLSWTLSGLLWVAVISRNSVITANSISSLRYGLVAAAAWLFLHEAVQGRQWLGLLLVVSGIWLSAR